MFKIKLTCGDIECIKEIHLKSYLLMNKSKVYGYVRIA